MGDVTHEQVNLMLRLYDMRREPRLREAREWFMINFYPASLDDLKRMCPPGSRENAFMRMVVSYWEMVSSIVNRGLIDEDLFFESTGEHWMVWDRLKPVAAEWRAMFKNPHQFANIEEQNRRMEAWREKRAPGSTEAMRQAMAQMRQAAAQAASKSGN